MILGLRRTCKSLATRAACPSIKPSGTSSGISTISAPTNVGVLTKHTTLRNVVESAAPLFTLPEVNSRNSVLAPKNVDQFTERKKTIQTGVVELRGREKQALPPASIALGEKVYLNGMIIPANAVEDGEVCTSTRTIRSDGLIPNHCGMSCQTA